MTGFTLRDPNSPHSIHLYHQVLAKELAQHFEEEEMYRVDHYLGKPGVMAIGEFRYWHNSLLSLLLLRTLMIHSIRLVLLYIRDTLFLSAL